MVSTEQKANGTTVHKARWGNASGTLTIDGGTAREEYKHADGRCSVEAFSSTFPVGQLLGSPAGYLARRVQFADRTPIAVFGLR
jgi:hypothetical protein